MASSSSPIDLLRKACIGNLSANSSLSDDGKTLTLLGTSNDAKSPQNLILNDVSKGGTKEATYTLASIYLQLLNPSVLQYRKACEAGDVKDPVKILDKGLISDYFFDAPGAEEAAAAAPPPAPPAAASAADEDDAKNKAGDDAMDMDMDMSDDEADKAAAMDGKGESVKFSAPSASGGEKRHRSGREKDRDRSRRDSRGREKDKDRSRSSRDRHHRSHSKSSSSRKDKDRDRDDDDDRRKSKGSSKPMVPITNEQLVANLSTIVDKRDTPKVAPGAETPAKDKKEGETDGGETTAAEPAAPAVSTQTTPATTPVPTDDEGLPSKEEIEQREKEDRDLLLSWLSPAGFQVNSPTVAVAIEADREAVRKITSLEIPVGDSASILRAGAGGEVVDKVGAEGNNAASSAGGNVKKRDFARVLDIYNEVMIADEKAKRSHGKKRPPPPSSRSGKGQRSSGGSASASANKSTIEGNPIIVVPNAMTSAITMINAGLFLGKDAVFVARQTAMKNPDAGKRGGVLTVTKKLNQRLGGAEITYDVIDNPTTRLKKDDWNRVVAVICQGAAWQFKGWRYSDPVDLFSRTFGFYVGMEGANIPAEVKGWNAKIGSVNRDRRGLDNVCLASFWNGLEEFMQVHKPDFLKG